jgi:hypothetical protein
MRRIDKPWLDDGRDVTVRVARGSHSHVLERLAILASASPPAGDVLVAEVEGVVWAAVSVETGELIADPFRATRAVRELLAARRRNLLAATEPQSARAVRRLLLRLRLATR